MYLTTTNSGITQTSVNPSKKIQILSTVIIKKPSQIPNNYPNAKLKQPQLLKELSLNLINMALKKKTKKKTLLSKVRSLREVSKTDNENVSFVAVCKNDLSKSLQTLESSDCEIGSLLKSAKKTGINVSSTSDVLFRAGTSNMAKNKGDLRSNLKITKTFDCGREGFSKLAETSQVLKTILIPRNQENIKFNKNIKETYKIMNKNDPVLSDKIPSPSNNESEQTANDYSVNSKVLVRYYTRNKTWKYYIGVITVVNADQTFDVSFYAMTRTKGEIRFKKPKKIDRDTVPKTLIVKTIAIDKMSEKLEEYILHDPADAIYF